MGLEGGNREGMMECIERRVNVLMIGLFMQFVDKNNTVIEDPA